MPDRPDRPAWLWPRAAYVHVPFCAHHCGYCDFAVAAGQDHLIDLYVEAVAAELAGLGAPAPVDTLFLGGGTPTHLSPGQLAPPAGRRQPLAAPRPGGEFSVEGNPESVTADKVARPGRPRGQPGQPRGAVVPPGPAGPARPGTRPTTSAPRLDRVRRRIANVSLDLIFGVPGQSVADWDADLDAALAFAPDHVSTYGLTYEKGTPLWKRRRARRGPARSRRQTSWPCTSWPWTGCRRPGSSSTRCRTSPGPAGGAGTTRRYWANEAYFGFGVGAARYVDGPARAEPAGHGRLRPPGAGRGVADVPERAPAAGGVGPRDGGRAVAAVGRGDPRRFREQTAFAFDALTAGRVAAYAAEGLLEDDGTAVRLDAPRPLPGRRPGGETRLGLAGGHFHRPRAALASCVRGAPAGPVATSSITARASARRSVRAPRPPEPPGGGPATALARPACRAARRSARPARPTPYLDAPRAGPRPPARQRPPGPCVARSRAGVAGGWSRSAINRAMRAAGGTGRPSSVASSGTARSGSAASRQTAAYPTFASESARAAQHPERSVGFAAPAVGRPATSATSHTVTCAPSPTPRVSGAISACAGSST